MKKGKILFTGGNGFLGRQIIPLLEEEGWDIVRPRSSKVRLEVDAEVDTLFENDIHYDAIINAALVGGRRDADDSRDIFYRNMMMFETLFNMYPTELFMSCVVYEETKIWFNHRFIPFQEQIVMRDWRKNRDNNSVEIWRILKLCD